jgi:DNA-binding transcriptional LysR family regulator
VFDLKQIRCFVAAAEELHFGRAARRLHMTQPPLSRQIQMLEYELGVPLFLRTSRSVKLTPAGRTFHAEATRILGMVESATASTRRTAEGRVGVVRLGFTAGSSYEFLPRMLARTAISLRDVEIVLTEMVSKQQAEALRARTIDMGLLRSPSNEKSVESVCVARERMLLAVPRTHRMATGRLPDARELAKEPFITFSPRDGYYFFQLIDSFLASMGAVPQYVQQVSQIHSILALVSAGLGIAMVPESARLMRYRGIILRPLKQNPPLAELHLAWQREIENAAVPALVKLVRQHFVE